VLSQLPAGFGGFRIALRVYQRQLEALPRDRLVEHTRFRDGSRYDLDLSDWMQAQAFLLRRYEEANVRFISSLLGAESVMVDAGAHVGLVSLQVAARAPGVTVHAFEPHPELVRRLRWNVSLNRADVRVEQCALAADSGEVWMTRGSDLVNVAQTASEADGPHALVLQTVTLDDYLQGQQIDFVDVLKLDVEGYELMALRGADQALQNGLVGCVVVEINHAWRREAGDSADAVARELERHGFHRQLIRGIGPSRVLRNSRVVDAAFVRI
jgi:FkbM family methyltransferase